MDQKYEHSIMILSNIYIVLTGRNKSIIYIFSVFT